MADRLAVIRALRAAGVECFTRAEWGSPQERAGKYAERAGTRPMPSGPASYHFLHITVTADTDTVREGAAGARQIETYGYSSPPMVSYQDLVTNEGRYFQGQDYGTKGTHTVNDKKVAGFPHDLNLHGYATALLQNVDDEVTDEQVRVVAMIFAARELAGLVRRGAPIYPHRTFDWKACPGDRAVARLEEISRLRTAFVNNGLSQEDDMAQYAELLNDLKTTTERTERKVDRLAKRNQKQTDRIAALAKRLAGYDKTRDGDVMKVVKSAAADLQEIATALAADSEEEK